MIRKWCRKCRKPERERRRARGRCVPIHEPAYKRPDPLIYSQQYLMKLGLAVTWNNPDIQLYLNGAPVSSSSLQAATTYDIVARVWNNSTEAPVASLPVHVSYRSFGAGAGTHAIGDTIVSLGVKGGPNHPALATVPWTTPAAPGHYCIQVLLDWLDDLNPQNNLGQENTNVAKVQSPASFTFVLGNPTREQLRYHFAVDAYELPAPPPCREGRLPLTAHNPEKYPLPAGWNVTITPDTPSLAPGEEQTIQVVVNAPDGFQGTQAINVNAFNRYGPAGGVTLYVEGA